MKKKFNKKYVLNFLILLIIDFFSLNILKLSNTNDKIFRGFIFFINSLNKIFIIVNASIFRNITKKFKKL